MTRLFTLFRPQIGNAIPNPLRQIAGHLRMRRDICALRNLPSDRLADMGIAPRTSANRRTSGEAGDRPQVTLW